MGAGDNEIIENVGAVANSKGGNLDLDDDLSIAPSIDDNSKMSIAPSIDDNSKMSLEEYIKDSVISLDGKSDYQTDKVSEKKYEYPAWYTNKNVQEKSLEDQSNWFSFLSLSFIGPLLKLGGTKVLDIEDVGKPSECDKSKPIFAIIDEKWEKELQKAKVINESRKESYDKDTKKLNEAGKTQIKPFVKSDASLAGALFSGFGAVKICFAIFLSIISAMLAFVPVLILEDLVKYFEASETENYSHDTFVNPWVEVTFLFIIPSLNSLVNTHFQVITQHGAIFVRTSVSTLLYNKALKVSNAGRACTSTGQVVNMMSNDTVSLQRFIQFGGMTFTAPLTIIVALILIHKQVGDATWVGVAFMVALAPVNIAVFSVVGKMRRKVLKYSDLRVKMMNEILAGIRIIKFYAWEKPFKKEVGQLRGKELKALTNLAYVSAIGFSLILLSAPIIQPILVFMTYVKIQDEPLTASKAFATVAYFNIMRFPFAFLPMGLLQYIQSKISIRRIATYLQLPELVEYVIPTPHPDDAVDPSSSGSQFGSITMKNASFSWTDWSNDDLKSINEATEKKKKKDKKKTKDGMDDSAHSNTSRSTSTSKGVSLTEEGNKIDVETLHNISISIKSGDLVAIVGKVGSGKSSFLSSILGEMEPVRNSKVFIPRDPEKVEDCSFKSYCSQTPWIVNETVRGNILFGREFNNERYERVVEACALQDDLNILPAGDATEIGERGINLSGGQKARVSLARALYEENTKVVLLDDPLSAVDAHVGEHLFEHAVAGNLWKEPPTRILVTHHIHFLPRCDKVIVIDNGSVTHFGTYSELVKDGLDFVGAVDFDEEKKEKEEEQVSSEEKDNTQSKEVEKVAVTPKENEKEKAALKVKGQELTTKEEKGEGAVSASAYFHYAKAGGKYRFFSLFVVQGLGRGSEIMASFWLAYWAKNSFEAFEDGHPMSNSRTTYYVNIYALFGMLGVACLTVRAILMANHRLHASKSLHDNLTTSIMRAPVSFFDVTPTGRILNRFAADVDKIDQDLTQSIGQGVGTIFSVLGALGAIIAATKGTFLGPLLPLGYIYYIIQKWFRKTSTELQRVTSIVASPIFIGFSQILSGPSTVRAYNEQHRFFGECQNSFDNYNAAYSLFQMSFFWFGLRLDLLGGLIGTFIGVMALSTRSSDFIPAGFLGLALSYSIEITNFLKHGVRMIATIEADMSSVERVLHYTDNIEGEALDVIPENDPDPSSWPSKGEVKLDHCSMRYRDGPLVLKDICITIKGGEKIGIVGRTGSGKSSLMNLLFRITEIEKDGGSIFIDGVDVSKIGTGILRSKLSIIPQDPVMFSNTVRYNMDPFGEASDTELWDVLHQVELADFVAELPEGLEDQVAEGGENFSQGQRQLLCIARSLLRNPKVLVLDEATANIDNETDASIQDMIREKFSNSTVLTIAHRLNTIMDSDRIIVLDDGNVVEFDTPKKLLENVEGHFYKMVEKSNQSHRNEQE